MLPAPKERYFEDYVQGAVYEYGPISIGEAEIVEFGKRYDPQYLHVDKERARHGPYGGLIASGWQTAAMIMRLFVDQFLPDGANLGSPGIEELRWIKPVQPEDRIRARVTVISTRTSRSKPDRGIVETRIDAFNQNDEHIATLRAVNFMRRDEKRR
jgi:acyl dehydratase